MNLHDWLTQPGGLATRLRDVRTQAGLSGKELAERLGWPAPRVSKLEKGRQRPTRSDVDAWVRAAGADEDTANEMADLADDAEAVHRDWRRRLRHDASEGQADYNRLVTNTKVIHHFETAWVPGMLQTRDYAHAVMTEMAGLHGWDPHNVDTAVTTRLRRQELLYDSAKRFEFLLWEPVLATRAGGCSRGVMLGQLDRLLVAMDLPSVRFGVVPLRAPASTTPQNSFQMYDELVLVETFGSESSIVGEEADKYRRVLGLLWQQAAEGAEARRLVRAAVDALRAGEGVEGDVT